MVEILDQNVNQMFGIPTGFDVSVIGKWLMLGGVAILITMLLGAILIVVIINMKFNKKFVIFKKIAGKVVIDSVDTATFERIGIAGDYWARTRKTKKIVPRPKIEVARNTYWYYERIDGEWINFGIEDIDEVFKEANISYIDEDMRLQRIGIQKLLQQRLQKLGFWAKYGTAIGGVVFMVLVTVCLIILFTQLKDLVAAQNSAAQAIEKMANAVGDMAQRGSGLVPTK